MPKRYDDLFQWHADLLVSQRYDDLARQFSTPAVISCQWFQAPLRDHAELALYFRRYHVALMRRGVEGMQARVVACPLPGEGPYRVWVRWLELDGAGQTLSHAQLTYHCEDDAGSPRVRRLHFTETRMPEIVGKFPPRRLAAMR